VLVRSAASPPLFPAAFAPRATRCAADAPPARCRAPARRRGRAQHGAAGRRRRAGAGEGASAGTALLCAEPRRSLPPLHAGAHAARPSSVRGACGRALAAPARPRAAVGRAAAPPPGRGSFGSRSRAPAARAQLAGDPGRKNGEKVRGRACCRGVRGARAAAVAPWPRFRRRGTEAPFTRPVSRLRRRNCARCSATPTSGTTRARARPPRAPWRRNSLREAPPPPPPL
jgi:hypothetical protein